MGSHTSLKLTTPIWARLSPLLECRLQNRMLEEEGVSLLTRSQALLVAAPPQNNEYSDSSGSLCTSVSVFLDVIVFTSPTNTDAPCLRTVRTNNPSPEEQDRLCILSKAFGAARVSLFPALPPTNWSCPQRHHDQRRRPASSCQQPLPGTGQCSIPVNRRAEPIKQTCHSVTLSSPQECPVAAFKNKNKMKQNKQKNHNKAN